MQDIAGGIYNQAMLKVFRNLGQFSGKGEFEGWVRRIVVNTCIDHCRTGLKFQSTELSDSSAELLPIIPEAYNRIGGSEIIKLIHELPKNTGLVFNLFVLEGYKHEEIGKILGISSGTSKWHLNEARKLLKQKLEILFKKESLANAI
jgi:RNA polymerase sigma-70 factor (ECF subfamily)